MRSGAEPRRKSNFVHFSLEIWHQVESNLLIFLWESIINQSVSRIRLNLGGLATIWGCLCNPRTPAPARNHHRTHWVFNDCHTDGAVRDAERDERQQSGRWRSGVGGMLMPVGRLPMLMNFQHQRVLHRRSSAVRQPHRTLSTAYQLSVKGGSKKSKLLYCDRYFKG